MSSIKTHDENFVTELPEGTYFVFGSNTKGWHGAGAAKDAHTYFGAVYGQGEGLTGQSYALPTKTVNSNNRLISCTEQQVRKHINNFITHVKENPDKTYYLTRVGCNLAGFTDEFMSRVFMSYGVINNIIYPEKWISLWQNT